MSHSSSQRSAFVIALVLASLLAAGAPSRPAAAGPVPLPSFACYEPTFSAFTPRSVRLADEAGARAVTLGAAVGICSAAGLNGRAATDSAASAVCHLPVDRRAVSTTVTLGNLYGRTLVDLVGEHSLCVPASVATGGPLAALPSLDAFACYAVRRGRDAPRRVLVFDRFGRSDDVLGPLAIVCAPVSLDGSKPQQRGMLACYRLTSPTRNRSAVVRSRFGLMKTSTGLRKHLCVPSTRL